MQMFVSAGCGGSDVGNKLVDNSGNPDGPCPDMDGGMFVSRMIDGPVGMCICALTFIRCFILFSGTNHCFTIGTCMP